MNITEFLKAAKSILLVDWADPGVPRSLINAGFTVIGYSPGRYCEAYISLDFPEASDTGQVIPAKQASEEGYLIFRSLECPPSHVDIVNTYRPAFELPVIIEHQALPLGGKVLWVQPPETSAEAKRITAMKGIEYVEGLDIMEAARDLFSCRQQKT